MFFAIQRDDKLRRKNMIVYYENGFLRRGYSQGSELCLNEGDEVVDCDLIIICEYEIAVGRMKELG